jgi:hypothetical protein
MTKVRLIRLRWSSLGLALTTAACLLPPPGDATTPGGQPAQVVSGTRFMIWDGDGGGLDGGQSWADCNPKPGCKATLQPAPRKGRNDSGGLAYHAEGKEWNGGGWNWLGWYPPDGGNDISPYDTLEFWVRLEAESEDKAPGKDGFGVLLGCSSNGGKSTATAMIAKYSEGDVYDGEWHKVVVPLSDLYIGREGEEFDKTTAWEFRVTTWDPHPRNFTVYFDEIAFVKN